MAVFTMHNPKDDIELEKAVFQAIQERGSFPTVGVAVKDGYVNLWGWVDGVESKKMMSELVGAVPGVQMVTNHIRVLPWLEKREGAHF